MGLEWNSGLMISLTSQAADDNLITTWVYMKCIHSLFHVIKTNSNNHTDNLTWWFSLRKWTHWPHEKDSDLENLEEWNMPCWLAIEEGIWPSFDPHELYSSGRALRSHPGPSLSQQQGAMRSEAHPEPPILPRVFAWRSIEAPLPTNHSTFH